MDSFEHGTPLPSMAGEHLRLSEMIESHKEKIGLLEGELGEIIDEYIELLKGKMDSFEDELRERHKIRAPRGTPLHSMTVAQLRTFRMDNQIHRYNAWKPVEASFRAAANAYGVD